MSLKKKIILTFFISAFLIAILAAFEYLSFVSIRREIRSLELTDTVRSKSLQLRRHEKNFFLYSPRAAGEEADAIHRYLDDLNAILADVPVEQAGDALRRLRQNVVDYERGFDTIENELRVLQGALRELRVLRGDAARFFPLLEAAIYERPSQAAEFLREAYRMPAGHRLIAGLERLDGEIAALRKNGEDITVNAKDLDRVARDTVETTIRRSQAAILIVFPLFLASGIIMLFVTVRSAVKRLGLLMDVMDKTGRGTIEHIKAPVKEWGNDEVGLLIRKFDDMEDELELRQAELGEKSRELFQSRKLAAIGTLAAGVAHELNNPLNNISLSAQVLVRELGAEAPPTVREAAGDILGQTVRVKKIVGDLLEFARGREPQYRDIDLAGMVRDIFDRMRREAGHVTFVLESDEPGVSLRADPGQLEQVLINLLTNAVEAMPVRGSVTVDLRASGAFVQVRIADTGAGMPKDALDKIFEPFFTTKDKGTGLGLAIVFNIIRKHRGDITVESEEGKGTTFTITLPRAE